MTYYFTYGSEGQPYVGGWTEIELEGGGSFSTAIEIFRSIHPDRVNGCVNCAGIYTESHFKSTRMSTESNLGRRCVEHIKVVIERCE